MKIDFIIPVKINPQKISIMEATVNSQNDNQASFGSNNSEKSELMQVFEYQVNDVYWAYKDLLKEILQNDNQA